jgi:hypothetical protein
MKALYAQLDDIIDDYENGEILISEVIPFSMRKTVCQITHYILSKIHGRPGGRTEATPHFWQ